MCEYICITLPITYHLLSCPLNFHFYDFTDSGQLGDPCSHDTCEAPFAECLNGRCTCQTDHFRVGEVCGKAEHILYIGEERIKLDIRLDKINKIDTQLHVYKVNQDQWF